MVKSGRPGWPPTVMSPRLLGHAFAGRFRLLHPLGHFGFHRFEVEAGAALHRWILDECLKLLSDHLLHEHKSPELELEPIEILLCAVFRSIVGPALALERI